MKLKTVLRKTTKFGVGLTAFATLLLAGCGGGSSTPAAATPSLSGIAAVGYPIVGGAINVRCAAGSALAPITTGSTGAWQIGISGQTLPCAVQVSGGAINGAANATPYHSITTAAGTVNVTPLTDLMVANLAGTATPDTWFTGLGSTPTPLTAISQTNVDTALTNLRSALPALTPLGTINPITTTFTAVPGNTSDDMLAALQTAMTNTSGVTHATLLGNASAPTFTAPTGFGTALTTAYAGTASGGTGGGSTTPTVTGFSPTSGAVSTTVTITGTNLGNFTPAPLVKFGTNTATVTSANTTTIVVSVPASLATGNSTITLSNGDGTGSVTVGAFNVTAAGGSAAGTLMGGAIQGTPLNLTGTITAFAGSTAGLTDGTGTAASFNNPKGITTDGTNLYVAESQNRIVRKIVIATGVVTTLAGSGSSGAADGTGTAASFNMPQGITTDGSNLYVTDYGSSIIRKIVISTGAVTTLAGLGTAGFADGTGAAATFSRPDGITTDGSNLYVADSLNRRIRKIVIATGAVTTFAGSGAVGTADGTGTAASFGIPKGITTDGTNLYVTDELKSNIRKIVIATGVVSTVAGSGAYGSADGTGTAATFNGLRAITTDGSNLYVADGGYPSGYIRKIVIATGVVSTPTLWWGQGITTDGSNLYVTNNTLISKIQ